MAYLLDHQTSGNSGLRVRDVRKAFIMVDAEHNPVTSMCAKGEAPRNSIIEWVLRNVAKATNTDGVLDGVEVSASDFQNFEGHKALLQGRLQKIREAIGVGDIAESTTSQYGMAGASLFKEATMMALQKLRSKMEAVTIADKDSVPQDNSTAFVTRGLAHWIGKAGSGDLPLATAFTRTPAASIYTTANDDDTADVITEDDVRAVMRSIFETTKRKGSWYLFCSTTFKEVFSNFARTGEVSSTTAPLRRFVGDQSTSEIKLDVQRYTGDWGTLTLIPHLDLPTKVFGLLLDMNQIKLRMVRNARFKELEDRGGGPNGFCDAIMAVGCENPTAHGKFVQKPGA